MNNILGAAAILFYVAGFIVVFQGTEGCATGERIGKAITWPVLVAYLAVDKSREVCPAPAASGDG